MRDTIARVVGALRAPLGEQRSKPTVLAIAAVGLLAGFGGTVLVAVRANAPRLQPPTFEGPHPVLADFVVSGADGRPVSLKDFRGRVVVLDVWAVWCSPCLAALPALDSLAASYDTSRVVVLALWVDVAPAAALRYVAAHPYPHLRFAFAGRRLTPPVAYRGLPTTILVDPEGRRSATFSGWGYPSEIPTLRKFIAKLQAGGV